MAGEDRRPRAWHDVHSIQDAPREKQKATGRIAAEEAAARKKIEALRALRLAKEAEEAQNAPPAGAKSAPASKRKG